MYENILYTTGIFFFFRLLTSDVIKDVAYYLPRYLIIKLIEKENKLVNIINDKYKVFDKFEIILTEDE